jgi:hypothetical protein
MPSRTHHSPQDAFSQGGSPLGYSPQSKCLKKDLVRSFAFLSLLRGRSSKVVDCPDHRKPGQTPLKTLNKWSWLVSLVVAPFKRGATKAISTIKTKILQGGFTTPGRKGSRWV